MYKDYFRLNEMPFSIAPDPRFLFMSDRHREALAHLLYGVQGEGGIVLLTGEVGTGKTTICRSLLEQLPENIDVAFILNPRMSVEELLQTVCGEYHIAVPQGGPGSKVYVDAIHARLLEANAQGRRAIVIVDEAQNLDPQVLEQLRLMTNLETNTRKLMQIILIGQPELRDLLAKTEMRQVAQRVIAHYHLTHLSQPEVYAYVAHRLQIAGAPPGLFAEGLTRRLYRATGGVPRLINLVCDRALLGTYVQGRQQVTLPTLRQAIKEVAAARAPSRRRLVLGMGVGALVGLGAAVAVGASLSGWSLPWAVAPAGPAAVAPAPPAPPATVAPAPRPEPEPAAAVAAAPTGAATSAPPAEPVLDSVEWPASLSRGESEALAFDAMFQRHGLHFELARGGDPCRQALEHGLRCYSGRGGIADLALLDQPAIMRMTSPDGREYAVTLVGLQDRIATLIVAGVERRVALASLGDTWSGRFVVIWRAPAGFGDSLQISQRGPAVAWLREALARIDGAADEDGPAVFNAALASRLRAFQIAEGIQPDGLVGPLTAIRLNVRSGQGGPRLTGDRKG